MMLMFCLFVSFYALFVLFVAVPRASREMDSLLRSAKLHSVNMWKEMDVWTSAALMAADGSGVTGLSGLAKKMDQLLGATKVSLYKSVTRAMTASRLVESHKHEFHGFGDVRHSKICFIVQEPDGPFQSLGPLVKSLSLMPRGHVEVAVYFASRDKIDDPSVRRRMYAEAQALNVRVRRVLCGEKSLSDCGAEQCFVDGFGYWIPARFDWTLTGSEHWGSQLVRGFKTRADLGAARIMIGMLPWATVYSRGHVKVFGPALGGGVEWALKVYGSEFVWDLPASSLTIGGHLDPILVPRNAAADAVVWHEHLCREQKWARFCVKEDVEHYSKLPHPHADVSLTRQEFEEMEQAAKAGHVADMGPILEAQRKAQEASRLRHVQREQVKAALLARERKAIDVFYGDERSKTMSEWTVRWEVLALLYDRFRPKPSWTELTKWPASALVERAEGVAASFADMNQLRVSLERLSNGLLVMPQKDEDLLEEAQWLLKNLTGVALAGVNPQDLRIALEKAWHAESSNSIVPMAHANVEDGEDDASRRKKHPCVVDSVTVPEPWFALYADDEMSNECFASKRNAEKCCDYSSDGALCVAAFHGHEAKDMKKWIQLCRMPHWGKAGDADDESQCRWAGVLVPKPWHRASDTPADACIAPKRSDETCCDLSDNGKFCIARFEGYSAQAVNDWMNGCRGKHWE